MDFEYSLKEVRNNPTATNAFFLAYEKAFKVQVKGCKSCNLSGKLNELNRYLKGMGIKDLNNRMKVRYRETIFSYIDKESKRAVRRYGRNLTLEFIKGFKENSTKAEMKAFASKFERLELDGFDWVTGEAIEVVDLDSKEIEDPVAHTLSLSVADAVVYLSTIEDEDTLYNILDADARKGVKTAIENALNK